MKILKFSKIIKRINLGEMKNAKSTSFDRKWFALGRFCGILDRKWVERRERNTPNDTPNGCLS